MRVRRAAPGQQLSTGRIRVDAGKAIAKLREYQLADRSAWVLEGIRAAVAAKANRIDLRADSNDVWLSWEGEPWPDELLPRLFDELVSPEAASERHHVRLLAAAVNSALGMEPAYVDVTAIRDGTATKVRYKPEILVEPENELGESALRHVETEAVAPPEGAQPGMLVHVRRKLLDWKLFGEPRELVLARDACRDISVPLHVSGLVLHRDTSADVLRLPLGEGLDGFIAVTEMERAATTASFDIAERGVVLAEYIIELADTEARAPVPVRVFIDAPRMPTNASRSQVRRDAHPIASAEKRAHALSAELMTALAKDVQAGSDRARSSALGWIASVAKGHRWHVDVPAIRGPLRDIAQLPIAKNAVGQPRALTAYWRSEVHTGKQPFPEELAPWLENVLWAPPGDPVRQLFHVDLVDNRATRRLVRWARRQLRAQQKFYNHQKRDARVLGDEEPAIRAKLGVAAAGSNIAQALFEGLDGEVCLYDEGTVGALVVLLDRRELERVEFDSPLPFDVVIDSAKVSPGDRYRGVKRDAEYSRVERAMRAGMVRALEAHALVKRARTTREQASDAWLYRRSFGVLRELGLPVKGPLADAPAFRKSDGTWASLHDLAKESVIGFSAPNRRVWAPHGRTVIELDANERATLQPLIKARLVPYKRDLEPTTESMINTAAFDGGGALIVRERGFVVAISPSTQPQAQLRLHHLGTMLDTRKYMWSWLPCTVAVDADALVPDENWSCVVDEAGVAERDFSDLELALLRATAHALLGKPPAELKMTEPVALDSRLGRALAKTLGEHEPRQILGDELLVQLRAAKLFDVHGLPDRRSIDDIAKLHEHVIPFIDYDAAPVAGYFPIRAKEPLAKVIGRLAGRKVRDGRDELIRLQRKLLGEQRLAALRVNPPRSVTVPVDVAVGVKGETAVGQVGVRHGVFEIRVFVEGRPFATVFPKPDLPLLAAVEVSADKCGDTFEGVPKDVGARIAKEIMVAIPELLVTYATSQPEKLADAGPVRTLLAKYLGRGLDDRHQPLIDDKFRALLAGAPAFPTVQGSRTSLVAAAEPRNVISLASWQGEWLGPADGESVDANDSLVVYVPDDEVGFILTALQPGAMLDVTDNVKRLQSKRRMARGLMPRPQVFGAQAWLKRPLSDLGGLAKTYGHGEIALVDDAQSWIHMHKDGVLTHKTAIDVWPSIALAVEEGDIDLGPERVQMLVDSFLALQLPKLHRTQLTPPLRRNLLRALLVRKLSPDLVGDLAIFYPYGDGAATWPMFRAQLDKFNSVWILHEPSEHRPLDEERLVLLMQHNEYHLARGNNWPVVEASEQLAFDELARRNRARPPARNLDLPSHDGVLAEVQLSGDGKTSPRGTVAVLLPSAAKQRGVWPHRAMQPFDRVEDSCRWPTLAIIDDARLMPDRTWSQPVFDECWQAIAKDIRHASEDALAALGKVPDDALTSVRIANRECADVAALRKAPKSMIRGVLWLTDTPREDGTIRVTDHSSLPRNFVPADKLSLGGRLFVFAPDGLDINAALAQLCGQMHGKLIRALPKLEHPDQDMIAAHVAHALAVRTVRGNDLRGVEFACFAPRPLDARALQALFKHTDDITLITPGMPPNPDGDVELVDDGTELSRLLKAEFGTRIRRSRPAPRRRVSVDAKFDRGPIDDAKPIPPAKPKPKPKAEPPEPPHPLRHVVARLRARMRELSIADTYTWRLTERAEPMFEFSDHELLVAGHNVRLTALAAALAAKSPWAASGVDVVVAHVVTVLNVALSHVTDANEAHALGVLLTSPSGFD